jgi:hypothetical protein
VQEGSERIPFGPIGRGRPQCGRGPDEELGVDVPRRVDDGAGGADLDQVALVEHGDPVRDARHRAEVVGDEDQGHAVRVQALEDLEHLDPDGRVDRAHRLVQEDQLRLGDQRAGHRDALALAAGQLAGQPGQQLLAELDPGQVGPRPGGRLGAAGPLDQQRLGQRLRDRQVRVEAAQRVLEHVLHHAAPAQRPPLRVRIPGDVGAVDDDPAPRGTHQAEDGPGERRLAGTGFADDADRLAPADGQRHAVQGAPAVTAQAVVNLQVRDF